MPDTTPADYRAQAAKLRNTPPRNYHLFPVSDDERECIAAALDRAADDVERLREALAYYADESCWENDIIGEGEELTLWVANGNGTEIARSALAQQQPGAGKDV